MPQDELPSTVLAAYTRGEAPMLNLHEIAPLEHISPCQQDGCTAPLICFGQMPDKPYYRWRHRGVEFTIATIRMRVESEEEIKVLIEENMAAIHAAERKTE